MPAYLLLAMEKHRDGVVRAASTRGVEHIEKRKVFACWRLRKERELARVACLRRREAVGADMVGIAVSASSFSI